MVRRTKLLALLLVIALGAICLTRGSAKEDSPLPPEPFMAEPFRTQTQDKSAPQEKTAEQVYKNIQVFKGVPASQLEPAMAFISGSLGVRCSHCHVNPFEKDDKPTKQTARKMIRMVFDLNQGSFGGQGAVSCYTCHRGQTRPVSVPAVGLNLWQQSGQAAKQEAPLPSVEQVLERYAQASGGRAAVERVSSRVWKGSRVGAVGVLVPEEVYAKAPNKLLIVTSYPNMVFRTGFDGSRGWAKSNQEVRDLPAEVLAQIRREAEFYKEIRLKEIYSKLAAVGRYSLDDVSLAPADCLAPDDRQLRVDVLQPRLLVELRLAS